ncbi:MAG: hypothetical protein FJW96_04330, partial [Actinobacteria bacterium]|nr:hypothetical protein [Actinomycetota bacterium]
AGERIALVPVTGRLRFDSFRLAFAAALAGLGIVPSPAFACARAIEEGLLVDALPPVTVGEIWLVQPGRTPAARARAFVELVHEHFPRSSPHGAPGSGSAPEGGATRRSRPR